MMETNLFEAAIEQLKHAPRAPIAASEIGGDLAKKASRFYALAPDLDITEAYVIHAAACMIDPSATLHFSSLGIQLLGFTPPLDELPLRNLWANIEHLQTAFSRSIKQNRDGTYLITNTPELGTLNIIDILHHLSENSPRISYYRQLPKGVVAHDAERLPYRGIVSEADFQRLVEACYADGTDFDLSSVDPSIARVPADIMGQLMPALGLSGTEFTAPPTRAGDIHHIGRVRAHEIYETLGMPIAPNLFQKAMDAIDGIDKTPARIYPGLGADSGNAALYNMALPSNWEKPEEIILAAALKKLLPQCTVTKRADNTVMIYSEQEELPLRRLHIEIGRIQQAIKRSAQYSMDGSVCFQQTPDLDAYGIHLGVLFNELMGTQIDVSVFMKIPKGMVVTDSDGNRYTDVIEQTLLEKATTNFLKPDKKDFTFSHLLIPPHVWRQYDYTLGMHEAAHGRSVN